LRKRRSIRKWKLFLATESGGTVSSARQKIFNDAPMYPFERWLRAVEARAMQHAEGFEKAGPQAWGCVKNTPGRRIASMKLSFAFFMALALCLLVVASDPEPSSAARVATTTSPAAH
jgi:hypothetical protein